LALSCAPASRAGFNPEDLDPSVKPQDDFFRYVNGKWIEKNPIPEDHSSWGVDYIIDAGNVAGMRALCEAAANKGPAGTTVEREVGDL
jgi:putative endopeptidase